LHKIKIAAEEPFNPATSHLIMFHWTT